MYIEGMAIDVWMMKKNRVASSWNQLCTVPMTFGYS